MKKISLTPPQNITPLNPQTANYVGFCRGCQKTVEMISFHEAAQIAGASHDEIIMLAADLHIGIRPEALLICLDSLLQADL